SGGGTWTEVYSGASLAEDVPLTHFKVRCLRANNSSLAPCRCDTNYDPKFPLADSECTVQGALSLRSGRGVARCHPARQIVIAEPPVNGPIGRHACERSRP